MVAAQGAGDPGVHTPCPLALLWAQQKSGQGVGVPCRPPGGKEGWSPAHPEGARLRCLGMGPGGKRRLAAQEGALSVSVFSRVPGLYSGASACDTQKCLYTLPGVPWAGSPRPRTSLWRSDPAWSGRGAHGCPPPPHSLAPTGSGSSCCLSLGSRVVWTCHRGGQGGPRGLGADGQTHIRRGREINRQGAWLSRQLEEVLG